MSCFCEGLRVCLGCRRSGLLWLLVLVLWCWGLGWCLVFMCVLCVMMCGFCVLMCVVVRRVLIVGMMLRLLEMLLLGCLLLVG